MPGEQRTAPLPAVPDVPEFRVPATLPPDLQDTYRRLVEELQPRGLREPDLDALEMMVHALHAHRQARAWVLRYGAVLVSPSGRPYPNPALKIARDEAATYTRLAQEYGLTLAARLRLGLMQLAGESLLQSLNADLDARAAAAVQAGSKGKAKK